MRPLACLIAAVLAGCGSQPKPEAEYPPLGAEPAPAAPAEPLTEGAPVDFSACRVLAQRDAIVDLRCEQAAVSEFRADPTGDAESMLDEVMKSLAARYGAELDIEESRATIDEAGARVRVFRGEATPPVSGIVVSLDNAQGVFWAVACFREDLEVDLDWCKRAIATVARSGGASEVGAVKLDPLDFAGTTLTVPEGCQQSAPGRIACDGAELSWMVPDGRDPEEVRDETLERLRTAAAAEKVALDESSPSCQLAGIPAECRLLSIVDPAAGDRLSLLVALATVSGTEILAVCSYTGEHATPPPPCDQVLTL